MPVFSCQSYVYLGAQFLKPRCLVLRKAVFSMTKIDLVNGVVSIVRVIVVLKRTVVVDND